MIYKTFSFKLLNSLAVLSQFLTFLVLDVDDSAENCQSSPYCSLIITVGVLGAEMAK